MNQLDSVLAVMKKWGVNDEDGVGSGEDVPQRLLRALLKANACVEDLRRVLRGEKPIRPLTDYPK